jgi:hypothetical protein
MGVARDGSRDAPHSTERFATLILVMEKLSPPKRVHRSSIRSQRRLAVSRQVGIGNFSQNPNFHPNNNPLIPPVVFAIRIKNINGRR